MRKLVALLLVLFSVIPFYFTYKTATKEIGRTTIIGSDKAYTRIYTPFDYQQNNQDQYLNNVIGNYLGKGNAGDKNQYFL